MLSDRARKWLRQRFEKWAGTFYDGPRPPEDRLREQVVLFANMYPNATRAVWVEFATGLAEEVWRSAYLQGVEWAEREDMGLLPDPERIMDEIDPEWRDSPSALEDPDRIVPETIADRQLQARELTTFERVVGRARKF